MGILKQIVAADTRVFDNPKDPFGSDYVLIVPNTIADAVYMPDGRTLAEFLLTLTENCEANRGRVNNHIGRGGAEQHPLANGMPGFSEKNFTDDALDEIYNGSHAGMTVGVSENDDVVVRTGAITAASGTVVFKTPFDTAPYVFIPQGGTTANITAAQFIFSGSAAGRFWVAITDNSD